MDLRMRSNGYDRNLSLAGAVTPKQAISRWGVILSIRLEDLLLWVIGVSDGIVGVRLVGGMFGARREIPERFFDLFDPTVICGRVLQPLEFCTDRLSEEDFKH